MCIAAPVLILDIGEGPMPMGHVLHAGETTSCCFAYVPEARVGDFVLVQNGFAMQVLDGGAVEESLAAFEELAGTLGNFDAPGFRGRSEPMTSDQELVERLL
ncbi:MAG: HypC/HybG/HupF family hydrogenase formation chaperone [Propionibacteriaceae bacterium]|jgi:hydrogenase expression/formation protein HypC|nr:HypC/HybG/HupF family hydrogenase formation chaperone [Propionibacteriaceae bacterium]